MVHFQTHGRENIMQTLTFNLQGLNIVGGLTDDHLEEVTMEGQNSYESASIEVGLTCGEEVEILCQDYDIDVSPDMLDGHPDHMIAFAHKLLEDAVTAIKRDCDRAKEAQASAAQQVREMGQRLDEAKAERRAAQNKLDAVWPAVLEVIDHGFDPSDAGTSILNRLRGLGLGPEVEAEAEAEAVAVAASEYDIVITCGGTRKIDVITVIRSWTGMDLAAARMHAENTPSDLGLSLSEEMALELKAQLVEAGATADMVAAS